MAGKQVIVTIPAVVAGSGQGTPLNQSFQMCNENFTELYDRPIATTPGDGKLSLVIDGVTTDFTANQSTDSTVRISTGAIPQPRANSFYIGTKAGQDAVASGEAGVPAQMPFLAGPLPKDAELRPGMVIYHTTIEEPGVGLCVYNGSTWVNMSGEASDVGR
tara:strand:+ start:1193 stop:1675 length:483 start_codon:yes stop_codon:yes gene_type:complete